jgi:hypothetical protein
MLAKAGSVLATAISMMRLRKEFASIRKHLRCMICPLDPEFKCFPIELRIPKKGDSPQRRRGHEGRNGFKFRVRVMVSAM